jgi:hypothetical protein
MPGADRLHGELGGIAGDADADETGVAGLIVHTIGRHLTELFVDEIMHIHGVRVTFWPIIGSAILEVADQFLLLGIDRNDGLPIRLCGKDFRIDILELGIAVGMVRPFVGLTIVLAREAEFRQFLADTIGTDRMSHRGQRRGELRPALRHP